MFTKPNSNAKRLARVRRVRAKISGTAERPRLSIHRSLTSMSVQLIDDVAQKTLAAASDRGMTGTRVEKAKAVGKKIAELALAQKISTVVFDRAGFRYHGRVAAVAEGARENGLTI